MKSIMHRFVAATLCLILPFSFAACAKTGGEAPAATKKEAATEKSAKAAGAGKRVYFAGPLFNQAEKDFNTKLAQVLEDAGYQVFLPQRDGIEAAQLEGKSEEALIKMIFELDAGEVKKADILFMNLDGRVPDEGACVELGIAFASGKRCYGFKTDTRACERSLDLNPMISGCMTKIFNNLDGDKLIEEIKAYLAENEL